MTAGGPRPRGDPRHRTWWGVYAACAVVACGALAWVSHVVLRLEGAEAQARVEVEHEQAVRLALWRIDSWTAPILAAEAARGVEEYALAPLSIEGVVLRPPLLDFRSRHVRLHFQLADGQALVSPQAPGADARAAAIAGGLPADYFVANDAFLATLAPRTEFDALRDRVVAMERHMADVVREELREGVPEVPAAGTNGSWGATQTAQMDSNRVSTARRQYNFKNAREPVVNCAPFSDLSQPIRVGPFVGIWLDRDAGLLAYVRRVENGDARALQGFVADWTALREDALAQVADLFPSAALEPVPEERSADDTTGRVLATIPAALAVPPPPPPITEGGPAVPALLLVWSAALAALLAGGLTLRSAVAYGERRARFASSVTHELRTPLTTFRMYAEMLADGMVTDPEQQRLYLRTLQVESERLSSVVENVLAYSRLEQGRAVARMERVTLADLVARLVPRLERRASDAGMAIASDVRGVGDQVVQADVEAVGQILGNLVDNACKYGASSDAPRLEVSFDLCPGRLVVEVRDRGPGVPPGVRRRVFEPFDRGGRDDGAVPGIGLGLALSRGLARELGGDLVLDAPDGSPGAHFRLTLPV